uniref:Uncharacterized protein n=1 Tax=Sphaerodactylus townsendi TaxID=933632 RepID=A0ACB8G2R2_9SAUR
MRSILEQTNRAVQDMARAFREGAHAGGAPLPLRLLHQSTGAAACTTRDGETGMATVHRRVRLRSLSRCCASRRRPESSSSESEYDPVDDAAHADGTFWYDRAAIPVLPDWLARRAEEGLGLAGHGLPTLPLASGGGELSCPPGWHMARRIRKRALAGYYVDVFDVAKPSGQPGVTGRKYRPTKRRCVDRTFDNWLNGYQAYAAMLSAAFPRGHGSFGSTWAMCWRPGPLPGTRRPSSMMRNSADWPPTQPLPSGMSSSNASGP